MHLIINSYGATLQKENGLFVISSNDGKQSIPPDKVKSISISKAAKITSDAVLLAIQHQVDILFVNDMGMPEGRVWSVKYGSISDIRRAQLNFYYSDQMLPWVKALLAEKLNNQVAMLLVLQPEDPNKNPEYNLIKFAINTIEDHKRKIEDCEAVSLSDIAPSLRGWEGAASSKYFRTISAFLPKVLQFENRNRQPATDIFNALLNYAYGMMYGKVEGALIKAGIDPYAGLFHRDEYNRPALVYDIIEKYRMWMDYVVIQLCRMEAIPADYFEFEPHTRACRLEAMAKRILIQAVNDYLSEIINLDGQDRSRQTHIDLQAKALAQFFLKQQV